MPPLHILLGILIATAWGFNYTAIHIALQELPPIFLCSLRFFLVSIPAVFFVKKPSAPFRKIAVYGLIMFAIQFSLMFMGISMGMTPGLASILLQTQAIFTMLFAVLVFKEKLNRWQIMGAVVSFSGIGLVGINIGESVGLAGFLMILSAAIGWGVGSILVKKMGPVNHFGLIVWASLVAWPPLLAFSLLVESPDATILQLVSISQATVLSVLYTTLVSTCFGFVAWNWLIAKYPITLVAPFTLLVPIFGISGSAFYLSEPIYLWKIVSAFLVISGVLFHQLGPRIMESKKIFLRKKEFD